VRATAVREALGEVGGAVSSEIFGRRGPGARIGRAIVTSNEHAQKAQAQRNERYQALSVVVRARQIVESASPIIGPRITQSLLRGLADAESAHRPDTTLRRVLQVAGRLEAHRPPLPRLVPGPVFPEALRELESGLRECIEKRLSALTLAWWADRVSGEIRSRAEKRKVNRERVWPWLDGGDHPVVEYLEFTDYAKILLEQSNWEQAFSAVFVNSDALRVKLRELEPIRNDIAHSRKLSNVHRHRIETYAADILAAIDSTK
jgi:hypothetical protein